MWIILDTESTCPIFCKSLKHLIRNICLAEVPVRINTKTGRCILHYSADFSSIKVWYDDSDNQALINIFSMSCLADKYCVTMDTSECHAIAFHSDPPLCCRHSFHGLFYVNVKSLQDSNITLATLDVPNDHHFHFYTNVLFVNTTTQNTEGFIKREVAHAKLAKDLLKVIAFYFDCAFKALVSAPDFKCTLTPQDLANSCLSLDLMSMC